MKTFFLILTENSQKSSSITKLNISWMFLQTNMKANNVKKDLDSLSNKEISKELIDQGMPFNINYSDIKNSLSKINKNLIFILDLIKCVVDYNIKKNIVKSLYQSNLHKSVKLNNLKEEIGNKESVVKEASEYVPTMQSELTTLLTQKKLSLYDCLINKYGFLEKYKFFYSGSNNESIQNSRQKIIIKLKGKYKSRDDFVRSLLISKEKNINVHSMNFNSPLMTDPNNNHHSINLNCSIPKLKLPQMTKSAIETTSTRSRNIPNNLYTVNKTNSSNNPFMLSNLPSKVYYTTERERNRDKELNLSITQKHKSMGSTIYKDIETLEHIIKEDKNCDVVPINFAMKPTPKPVLEANSHRMNSLVLEPNLACELNLDKINLIRETKDENENTIESNKEPKRFNSIFDEIKKNNHIISQTPYGNIFKIESNKAEYPKYFCCK